MEQYINTFTPLTIDQDEQWVVDMFSQWAWERSITVQPWKKLHYLALCEESVAVTIHIHCLEASETSFHCLCIWAPWSDVTITAHGHLDQDASAITMHLVSLLRKGSMCTLDGWVIIPQNVQDVSGDLTEELFLLEQWVQIKTLPRLDVQSSKVKASHGARIEQIDPGKIFYLRSRWLPLPNATRLLIWWHLETVFSWFSDKDENIQKIQHRYLEQLTTPLT